MRQYEAVMEVMRRAGGFSTLGFLYREVLKVPGVRWKTATPFASIRRIVQDPRFFFRIRPGLWALNECRDRLPAAVTGKEHEEASAHTYYQGLLVEIGNLTRSDTAVPAQDRNKKFLDRSLAEVSTLPKVWPFSYERFVRCASSVDVVWFNDRKMPSRLFEVEESTDMRNSLLKFVELQDFAARFFIVADVVRKREFENRMNLAAFRPFAERVGFLDYETVSRYHSRAHVMVAFEKQVQLP